MNNNPVVWFEIYVQDMARAKAFYGAMLGVAFSMIESPDIEMWAFPMQEGGGGASGALVRMDGVASGGNSVLVYFNCADCAVEAARAVDAGGRLQQEKMSIGPYGHIAMVVDPDGNMIGLHSMS
jgi:uncharacterized protein